MAKFVKSVGGKASILLALGEEDRERRLAVLRAAVAHRSGLRRRLADVTRRLYEIDLLRLSLVQAYIGYLWFWDGADHDRAQGHVDGTLEVLCRLIAIGGGPTDADARIRTLALRLMAGYVMGPRDLHLRALGHRRSDAPRG